jgi:hypothetical protein
VKVLPSPGVLANSMCPPCARTSASTMLRPDSWPVWWCPLAGVEALEHPGLLFGGDALAGVAHPDADPGAVAPGAESDTIADFGVLNCVAQKIEDWGIRRS